MGGGLPPLSLARGRRRRLWFRPVLGLAGPLLLPTRLLPPGGRRRVPPGPDPLCGAIRAAAERLLVLLRGLARLLPLRERLPRRLEGRATGTAGRPMNKKLL